MQIPPSVTYRNLEKTPAIEALVEEKIAKLERFCDYINSCRVVVDKVKEHPDSGSPYRVSIDITIPNSREIAVNYSPDTGKQYAPLEAVIRDAFEAAIRQIKDLSDEQQGERKIHPQQEMDAVVTKLFAEQDYGFLKTIDTGKEVYFHRNSVIHDDFDRITVGTGVRYRETQGEMGPQATTVQIVDKQGSPEETEETPDAAEKPLGWS
ncbi:HPF/RaiA family ribosome-associated protein [Myxosarcina sp. GI1(2024)]